MKLNLRERSTDEEAVSTTLKTALPKILIKSVVLSIVIFIFTLPSISFFSTVSNIGIATAFNSPIFLFEFVVLFALFLIYDYATSHRLWFIEDVAAGLFALIALVSTVFSPISIFFYFVTILIGTAIGATIRKVSERRGLIKTINGSIVFLLIIWVSYIVLANSNYYTPPTNSTINLNKVYLTKQQLQSVFGSGIGGEPTSLNAQEMPLGSLMALFPTPIQDLLFNFTFQNTTPGTAYYVMYYSKTYNTNFTELVVQTPQANIILSQQASRTALSGSVGNLEYVGDVTINPNSFTGLARRSDYLAIISCSGVLCTQQAFNDTINQISIGLGG